MPDKSSSQLYIFGIRHHGPGSARSLAAALDRLQPDCILIEGDPGAESIIHLAKSVDMDPPVAMLLYNPDNLKQAVYYPLAEFSPEWQAIQYGLRNNTTIKFMDLPQAYRLADEESKDDVPAESETAPLDAEKSEETVEDQILRDPIGYVAKVAGYGDGERWWERLVEEHTAANDIFAQILELMTELRLQVNVSENDTEEKREAWMRQTIRTAARDGYKKIAVVCGAWHGPVLDVLSEANDQSDLKTDISQKTQALVASTFQIPTEKQDQQLLSNLPKPLKLRATWVPWNYQRLSYSSGYGAGILAPGWYDHLWHFPESATTKWLSRAAHLLRKEGVDASTAQIIDALRLTDSLAALRNLHTPGLPELLDAWQTTFAFGTNIHFKLIEKRLLIDDRLGRIPAETPTIPLQQDIQDQQQKLRLPAEAFAKEYDLDLRKELDLKRSHFLHRLQLVRVDWGEKINKKQTGTFHEWWRLEWQPELVLKIIDAGSKGQTLVQAAEVTVAEKLNSEQTTLAKLTKILDTALLADLPQAADSLLLALQNKSAVNTDVQELLQAISPLVNLTRYGNVRGKNHELVNKVLHDLAIRASIGLPTLCVNLDEDTSREVLELVKDCHLALNVLGDTELLTYWQEALQKVADLQTSGTLLVGYAVRLLLDCGVYSSQEAGTRLSLALSGVNPPALAAGWLEGFLHGQAGLLLHDDELWGLLHAWVKSLGTEDFQELLPLLRRTFSRFEQPERRKLGEKAKQGSQNEASAEAKPKDENTEAKVDNQSDNSQMMDTLGSFLGF